MKMVHCYDLHDVADVANRNTETIVRMIQRAAEKKEPFQCYGRVYIWHCRGTLLSGAESEDQRAGRKAQQHERGN